jgi:MFS family permease
VTLAESPPPDGGTFASFRHRDFSWFWLGSLVSNTGSWMQNTALALVVFSFRQSSLDLGVVSFVAGLPVLFLALPAGLLADRLDKRKLLVAGQSALMLQAAALGVFAYRGQLSAAHPVAGLVIVSSLGLVGGALSALCYPAWQAMLPELVPRAGLMNAIALNSAQFQSSRLLGPLAASAFILAGATMGDIFVVNAASFLFVIAALWVIRPRAHDDPGRSPDGHRGGGAESPWRRLTAGVRYAREDRAIGALIVSTACLTIFGMPYQVLLPAIVHEILGTSGPVANLQVSWLMSASGLGAFVGALGVASLPRTAPRDRIIPMAILVMAVVLFAVSFARVFWLMLPLSALVGATFLTTNSLTNTSIQATVPGPLRGRVMGLYVMAFLGIMPISAAVFGPLGQAVGAVNAARVGAAGLAAWGVFLLVSGALTASSPGAQGSRQA